MIDFTPDQEQFRRSVARFVDAEVAPAASGLDERGEFPAALFRRIGELGYLGLRYPEKYGGADADMTTYCLFAEELARGSLSVAAAAAMQGLMGTYLEKNIRAFRDIQNALQEQSQKMYGDNSRASQELWAQFMNLQGPAMQSLMQAYMEQSQKMFAQFQDQMQNQARNMFSGLSFPGFSQTGKSDPEKQ